jgi:uncharacterized protein (DUF4415 family)
MKPRGRPKGEIPALVHVNLRLPPDVVEAYKALGKHYTVVMRAVLIRYMDDGK